MSELVQPTILIAERVQTSEQLCALAQEAGFRVLTPQAISRKAMWHVMVENTVDAVVVPARTWFFSAKEPFSCTTFNQLIEDKRSSFALIVNAPAGAMFDISESIYVSHGASAVIKYHAGITDCAEHVRELFRAIVEDYYEQAE